MGSNMIPQLRFPEYSDNWSSDKLGAIATFSKGKGISKSEIDKDGTTECVRYGELYTVYSEVITEIVSKTNIDANELVLSEEDDVIIPASGETQIDIATASCVAKSGVALGGDLNIIKSEIDGIFLSYYLNNARKKNIARLAQGISVVHLYASQLASLTVNIPTPPEQTRIATFLTAVDKRINLLQKKKAELEQYKKGVMQKLFSQTIRFKKDDGSDFADWEEKSLGDVCDITMGQSPDSKSYNIAKEGLPLIQGNADIQNRISNPRQWTNEPSKTCKIGDLILTVRAPVGSISKSKHKACIGRGVCSIKNNELSKQEFIFQLLLWYEPKWVSIEQGSTFTAVSGKDIRNLKFVIPNSLPEQQKIANFLSAIDKSIEKMGNQIDDSVVFKQGLLQKMFV